MERLDDHKLVQIQMGELRRLQKCDRETTSLRKRNQLLEDTLRRVMTLNWEAMKVLDNAKIKEGDYDGQKKRGPGGMGTGAAPIQGEKGVGETEQSPALKGGGTEGTEGAKTTG